jgi:hypothetical protein
MPYIGWTLALFSYISHFCRALPVDSASKPAATTRRTGKVDASGRSRMRELTMEFHPQARRGWPLDCMQPNCQRERGPSPRTGRPTLQVWRNLRRVVPRYWKNLEPIGSFARALLWATVAEAEERNRLRSACPIASYCLTIASCPIASTAARLRNACPVAALLSLLCRCYPVAARSLG